MIASRATLHRIGIPAADVFCRCFARGIQDPIPVSREAMRWAPTTFIAAREPSISSATANAAVSSFDPACEAILFEYLPTARPIKLQDESGLAATSESVCGRLDDRTTGSKAPAEGWRIRPELATLDDAVGLGSNELQDNFAMVTQW